jgi:hypothetical protein
MEKSKPYFTITDYWGKPFKNNPTVPEPTFIASIKLTHRLGICICGCNSFTIKDKKMYCQECGEYYAKIV